jgi:hypothetical protein
MLLLRLLFSLCSSFIVSKAKNDCPSTLKYCDSVRISFYVTILHTGTLYAKFGRISRKMR